MKAVNQTSSGIFFVFKIYKPGRFALLLIALFCATASLGQVTKPNIESPSKDSITTAIKSQVQEKKQNTSDAIDLKKKETSNKIKNLKSDATGSKDSVKSKLASRQQELKDTFAHFKDSLLHMSLKDVFGPRPSLADQMDSSKSKFKSYTGNLKKKVKTNTKLSGEIVSESFTTNYQDPFTVSEKTYSRFYGNPTIEVATLPFTVDFFVTTEDNTIYNSNTFNVRFNTEQFKNNLRNKANSEMQKVVQKKEILNEKKAELGNHKKRLERKLADQKSKLDQLEGAPNRLKDRARGQLPSKPSTRILDQALDGAKEEGNQRVDDVVSKAKSKQDSILNLENHSSRVDVNDIDTGATAEYEKRLKQYNELKKKYDLIDSVYNVVQTLDSAYGKKAEDLKKQISNPNFIKDKASQKLRSKKIAGILEAVDYFELGINYPFFSKLSLNGTPVKGVNTGFTSNKNHFKFVGGKTFNNQINTFGLGQPNPEFNRNVQGVLFEHKTPKGRIEVSNTALWDDASQTEPKRNFIQTVSFDQRIGKKLIVTVNTAHSVYSDNTNLPKPEVNSPSFLEKRLNQLALGSELRFRLDAQSKIKVEGQRIYPGFTNMSNPYMRNGYDEFKGQVDRKFFKRKLHTSVFYKHFSDNITGIQQSTNTMNGYGISARTNFKKAPNFFVQHAPYEQGNNHPDSIYRTNNQLSVTSAGMIYIKKVKKSNLSLITNYTRSQIDFNRGEAPVENTFYNAMVNLKRPKFNVSVNSYRNESKPNIDTLNYFGSRIEIGQEGSGKVLFSSSLFFDYYDSDDYRYNWVTTASFLIGKKLQAQTSVGLGQIDGLYGIKRKDVYSGRVLLRYRF